MAANPRVEVHLESTNRRVDVIAESFDIAIRVRSPPLEETDLVMRVLDESSNDLVASPLLLKGQCTMPFQPTSTPFPASISATPRGEP